METLLRKTQRKRLIDWRDREIENEVGTVLEKRNTKAKTDIPTKRLKN